MCSFAVVLVILLFLLIQLDGRIVVTDHPNFNNLLSNGTVHDIVNPLSLYSLCDYYIGTEINCQQNKNCPWSKNYDVYNNLHGINLLHPNETHRIKDIKENQFVLVQVNFIPYFLDMMLPRMNGTKIILLTSQYTRPHIRKPLGTKILSHNQITLWISQFPIYRHLTRYMAFPYGIKQHSLHDYLAFLKKNAYIKKKVLIENLHAEVHAHIPSNHVRREYKLFGFKSGPRLDYATYLTRVVNTEFLISTGGDREDCYRHYEAIGLGTKQVSNFNRKLYSQIFETSMIFESPTNMQNWVLDKNITQIFTPPNRDIITLNYWKEMVKKKMESINIIQVACRL